MIVSMTAFAQCSYETSWGILTWETRTVNHRYLEITLCMPELLRDFEQSSREIIQNHLNRGKVEAVLRFQPGQGAPIDIMVNQACTEQLAKATETVLSFFPSATINVMDVLLWPGILQKKANEVSVMEKAILDLLKNTLGQCMSIRQRAGEELQVFLEDRCNITKKLITSIKKRMPILLKTARERIIARFKELSVDLDQERLEQEILWLAQKVDVTEELQRLEMHINEVKRVINQEKVAGRRLDFLMQELNREANTLGNKSIDAKVSQIVIELKVQVEQMREQIQNIE